MAMHSTGTSDMQAIRMGSSPRKPMVTRRAIRCGGLACRCSSVRWPGKVAPVQSEQQEVFRKKVLGAEGRRFGFTGAPLCLVCTESQFGLLLGTSLIFFSVAAST